MKSRPESFDSFQAKLRDSFLLLLLAFVAIAIHGYHPAAEDAEIYVPQIRKILNPSLYPFGSEFFQSHARLTLFPNLIAASIRLTHISLDAALFIWQFAAIFLVLLACKRIASKCFPTQTGRWAAVAMVATLLTLPATGTTLYIMDQYLNPRSISAFCVLFAIDATLERKYLRTGLWLILTAVVHPLMTVFGIFYVLLLVVTERITPPATVPAAALLFPGLSFKRPSPAYIESLRDHGYYFLLRWRWYEWLGIFAPLALLWWFSRIARHKQRPVLELLTRSLFFLGCICFAAGLVITIPQRFELLTPILQPMRSFQLIYLLMSLAAGGLLGEWLLKTYPIRWIALFLPLALGMSYAQFQLFPSDRHIEWPGLSSTNPWVQAFVWARDNTPVDAIFALNPDYMALPGEDYQGFRAVAERSRLADATKDWSAVVMFPNLPLADECRAQVNSAESLRHLDPTDLQRVRHSYGVSWLVLEQPGIAGLSCPYQNKAVLVCRAN